MGIDWAINGPEDNSCQVVYHSEVFGGWLELGVKHRINSRVRERSVRVDVKSIIEGGIMGFIGGELDFFFGDEVKAVDGARGVVIV